MSPLSLPAALQPGHGLCQRDLLRDDQRGIGAVHPLGGALHVGRGAMNWRTLEILGVILLGTAFILFGWLYLGGLAKDPGPNLHSDLSAIYAILALGCVGVGVAVIAIGLQGPRSKTSDDGLGEPTSPELPRVCRHSNSRVVGSRWRSEVMGDMIFENGGRDAYTTYHQCQDCGHSWSTTEEA
jgi:hypothetical protein